MSSVDTSLKDRLRLHFNNVMWRDDIPLLSNFDKYQESLPVRRREVTGKQMALHQLQHWTYKEDLETLAKQLRKTTGDYRAAVKYLAAGGGSGKTSCILPAFLESTEMKNGFTIYLYMSFANNNENHFRLAGNWNEVTILNSNEHGASFILKCLKNLLNSTENYTVKLDQDPGDLRSILNEMKEYLHNVGLDNNRILLHLDEHRKMCPRSKEEEGCIGANFSRGAMQALSASFTVVATFTERPPLPSGSSSEVCRVPVAMPCLNIDTAMEKIDELKFSPPPRNFNNKEKRLWAILRFRLGMCLRVLGLSNLHVDSGERTPEFQQLLEKFSVVKEDKNTTEALEKCIQACNLSIVQEDHTNINPVENSNAVKLLLGVEETKLELIERQVPDTIVLDDNHVSSRLEKLLLLSDPKYDVYKTGRDRFMKILHSDNVTDYLSGTPLEVAYCWSLSCHAAFYGYVTLGKEFRFMCKEIERNRLFPEQNSTEYNMSLVKADILYYIHEKVDGKASHPLVDLYFCTKDKELVLINCTGGNDTGVEENKESLRKWIENEQPKVTNFYLRGVVLAPCVTGGRKEHGPVCIIRGKMARKVLGGLAQLFRWMG